MTSPRLTLLILPLAAASFVLGACGGGDPAAVSSGDQRSQFREAALKFAKCMREHGVDMPDPKAGGGGLALQIGGPNSDADPATMRKAQDACQKYMENIRPPELSEDQEREFKERALKFARCMREHGIDVPDPTFGENGRITQRIGPGGTGQNDPRFRDAAEQCSKYGPRFQGDAGR